MKEMGSSTLLFESLWREGSRVEVRRLQEAQGRCGGFHRQGEEPPSIREAHLAGRGERRHPCEPDTLCGLRGGHRCASNREAQAPAERRLLRLSGAVGWNGEVEDVTHLEDLEGLLLASQSLSYAIKGIRRKNTC